VSDFSRIEDDMSELYTVHEAARILHVSPKWLYERTRKGAIPCRRLGKYVRLSQDDVKAIIEQHAAPARIDNQASR